MAYPCKYLIRKNYWYQLLLLVGCLTTGIMMPGTAGAVDVGTLDDFESGGTMGWRKGASSTNPPTNINTGGPQGAGDNYLQTVSTGGVGADSKQVIFNTAQWTGDYVTAGVSEIAMDLRNSGGSTLHMRIALRGGAGVASWFSSTQAVQIPAAAIGIRHHLASANPILLVSREHIATLQRWPALSKYASW